MNKKQGVVFAVFPKTWAPSYAMPSNVSRYLSQEQDTLSAPDASVVMSAAAIDAMLKHKGLEEGSLFARIDDAVSGKILTSDMAKWAHRVRLNSNNPRHADSEKPHVQRDEAVMSLEFAKAMADILFVLPSRMPSDGEDQEGPS